jgi:hypothetical protein
VLLPEASKRLARSPSSAVAGPFSGGHRLEGWGLALHPRFTGRSPYPTSRYGRRTKRRSGPTQASRPGPSLVIWHASGNRWRSTGASMARWYGRRNTPGIAPARAV